MTMADLAVVVVAILAPKSDTFSQRLLAGPILMTPMMHLP
jgi:hypothetical protein